MRFRFKPTLDQRSALRAALARLLQPAKVLEVIEPSLPAGFRPINVICTVQSTHSDRFVMRVQVRSDAGEERAYALKAYSDEFGRRVWAYSQALAKHDRPNGNGLSLPIRYVPHERMLISHWLDALFLSEIVDDRKPELLRRAARLAAHLHGLAIAPEQPTTAQMIVEETRARCDRLRRRWPETTPIIEPLMAALREAFVLLDPADPAPVHGDMAPGQFLWTGSQLLLIDLDMFGYTDPAYDVGHFLAQMERRCLLDPTLPEHARQWAACFRDTYLAAMPQVSPRNVSFYRGLTLVRKIYTICRRHPAEWPDQISRLALKARAALEDVLSPTRTK